LVFLFFVLTTNAFGQSWFSLLRLAREGRTASASVSQAHTSNHDGCIYTFEVNENTFHGSRESCGDRDEGDGLTVHYLPSDPRINSGYAPRRHLVEALALALILPSVMAGFVGWSRRRSGRM
jgi:hypothetical protein